MTRLVDLARWLVLVAAFALALVFIGLLAWAVTRAVVG